MFQVPLFPKSFGNSQCSDRPLCTPANAAVEPRRYGPGLLAFSDRCHAPVI